jgi:hypothetical protein
MKKLSEAVRDGSQKTGKLEGGFAETNRRGETDTCAMGAAYVELTGDLEGAADGSTVMDTLSDMYPLIKDPDCFAHRTVEEEQSNRLTEKYGIAVPKELLKVTRQVEDGKKVKGCRCKTKTDIMNEIMERNDGGESRESIADWLESIGL